MARIILDTAVLIRASRSQLDLMTLSDEDDPAVPALVVAEFVLGILRTKDPARRAGQQGFLDDVLAVIPVENYTLDVAEHHAKLLAYTYQVGAKRGAHDLIIAATAVATQRTLVTTDELAKFDELPGLRARTICPGSS